MEMNKKIPYGVMGSAEDSDTSEAAHDLNNELNVERYTAIMVFNPPNGASFPSY